MSGLAPFPAAPAWRSVPAAWPPLPLAALPRKERCPQTGWPAAVRRWWRRRPAAARRGSELEWAEPSWCKAVWRHRVGLAVVPPLLHTSNPASALGGGTLPVHSNISHTNASEPAACTWPPRARARPESMPPAKLAAGRHRCRWEGLAVAGRLGSRCRGAIADRATALHLLRAGAPHTGCTARVAAARAADMPAARLHTR